MAKYCQFWTFCKGFREAKWLQNGRSWKRGSDQPTRWLIRPHVKETGTSKWREHYNVFTWPYEIHFWKNHRNRLHFMNGASLRLSPGNYPPHLIWSFSLPLIYLALNICTVSVVTFIHNRFSVSQLDKRHCMQVRINGKPAGYRKPGDSLL